MNGLQRPLLGRGEPEGMERTTCGASALASAAWVARWSPGDVVFNAGGVNTRREECPQLGQGCVGLTADMG